MRAPHRAVLNRHARAPRALFRRTPTRARGYTLLEMTIAAAVAASLLLGLNQMLFVSGQATSYVEERTAIAAEARLALARMANAVQSSRRVLVPLADNSTTLFDESLRAQTVPASTPQTGSVRDTAVLSLTIDPAQDLDADGVADADNDNDGAIDEDLPADTNKDGEPGIANFDDDGNGTADFFLSPAGDDDESNNLAQNEDALDGIDNDGDNQVDEDPGADNNGDGAPGIAGVDDDGDGAIDEGSANDDDEDGLTDEDWYDVVTFYLSGSDLVERRAVPWDENTSGSVDGDDWVESVLANNVSELSFQRLAPTAVEQTQLIALSLTLLDGDGDSFSLSTTVRLGGHL